MSEHFDSDEEEAIYWKGYFDGIRNAKRHLANMYLE